jgi:hypothetical protein
MRVREHYRPQPMAANSAFDVRGYHIGAFLATIAGTITVTDKDGTVLLNAMPIDTGANSLAMMFKSPEGGTVQLGGGAAGTLLI